MLRDKVFKFFNPAQIELFIEHFIQMANNASLFKKPNLPRAEYRTKFINFSLDVCNFYSERWFNLILFSIKNCDLSTVT